MKTLYFDTNIFIYLANSESSFNKPCNHVIEYCQHNNIHIVTSVETIQEIIHFSKNIKQLDSGIQTCEFVSKIIHKLLPINAPVIKTYLTFTEKYKTIPSRDNLHAAVCVTNDIDTIITYDKDFKKIKEVTMYTPDLLLKQPK